MSNSAFSANSNGIDKTILDAKGDIIAASAADTPAKVTVGANDTILVADSAQAAGVKWTSTLVSPTLTTPKIADLGYIADANGNEQIIFDTVTSAVNEITLANAATGGNPTITPSGGDANVGLDITPKGTGTVNIKGNSTQAGELRLYEDTDAGTNFTAFKVGTQAGDITYTLPTDDGDADQVLSTNGSGVLDWVTASGGSESFYITHATIFEDLARTVEAVGGSGAVDIQTYGARLRTLTTQGSYAKLTYDAIGGRDVFNGTSDFATHMAPNHTIVDDLHIYIGVADNITVDGTSGVTRTSAHQYGFFWTKTTPDNALLYATNANATSATETSIAVQNEDNYFIRKTSTTDIKFYYSGALKATHTTNLPSGNADASTMTFAASNVNTTQGVQVYIAAATYRKFVI